jgi:sec-independent protein translocase protein TatA
VIGSLGGPELLIILAIVVVLFGASRIAGLGSSLGAAIREFKREVKSDDDKTKTTSHSETTSQQPTASAPGEDRPSYRH